MFICITVTGCHTINVTVGSRILAVSLLHWIMFKPTRIEINGDHLHMNYSYYGWTIFFSVVLSSPAAHVIYVLLKDGKVVVARSFVIAEFKSVTSSPPFLGSKEIPTCVSNNNLLDINLFFFADINLCMNNCFVYNYNWVRFFLRYDQKKRAITKKMFELFFFIGN